MNKPELIFKIKEETGFDEETVEKIINSMLNNIAEVLSQNGKVALHGFGKFIAREYGQRKCYNPVSGELIDLKPSKQPAFMPGPKLRSKVNND